MLLFQVRGFGGAETGWGLGEAFGGSGGFAFSFLRAVEARSSECRCARRALAIQLDCFVAALLAMTVGLSRDVGVSCIQAESDDGAW